MATEHPQWDEMGFHHLRFSLETYFFYFCKLGEPLSLLIMLFLNVPVLTLQHNNSVCAFAVSVYKWVDSGLANWLQIQKFGV